ncbi:serine/threonine-protein kinase [Metallosphaera javensis (ex Sakai et al. 2022)]|uniref:serine/threonine-protein kinase n=1 Tax=Metallosphaera javensis (ex Sakai et al. 2022) TaxID=2775498 RepID=UPI002582A2AD|nr:MAG: serine/threonine-protein kinase ArnS [Metallosphaera javensis (ex Sakai et al. 2022)]
MEKLGEGGFATVYKALSMKTGQEVAIKIYKVVSKDFVKEVAVWLNLNHPNIVKLLDYDISPYPYVVMELMKRGTLEKKQFEKTMATRIILDVLEALKYAHSKGIIHRDIKPSNIILDESNHAKLSDWGIAKFAEKTTTANVYMTLQYASPEQLSGGTVDEKSDIYQVCEVFYEILVGISAFSGDLMTVTGKKLSENFVPPSALNSSLREFDPVFKRCFSPRKEERYSEDELIKVLSQSRINNLTTTLKTTYNPYLYVELIYELAKNENYQGALYWLKELNKRVECEDIIRMIDEKIRFNFHTREEILQSLELLRSRASLKR